MAGFGATLSTYPPRFLSASSLYRVTDPSCIADSSAKLLSNMKVSASNVASFVSSLLDDVLCLVELTFEPILDIDQHAV